MNNYKLNGYSLLTRIIFVLSVIGYVHDTDNKQMLDYQHGKLVPGKCTSR